MKRKNGRYFLKIFILFFTISMITHFHFLFGEENVSPKEFFLQGLKYNLAFIKDAQCEYVCSIFDKSGNKKYTKKVEWKYKTDAGKEYIKIEIFDEPGQIWEKTIQGSLNYLKREGMTIATYKKGVIFSGKPQGEILNSEKVWTFTNLGLPINLPPSSFFYLIWPGISIENILIDPETKILPEKEYVENDECYVIYLKKPSEIDDKRKYDFSYIYPRSFGYKIWICPEKGFFPRRIVILTSQDEQPLYIFDSITLKKFGENIWFPVEVVFFSPRDKKKTHYMIKYSNIKVNQGIKNEEFDLTFPPGAEVYDTRTGISFTVPEKK